MGESFNQLGFSWFSPWVRSQDERHTTILGATSSMIFPIKMSWDDSTVWHNRNAIAKTVYDKGHVGMDFRHDCGILWADRPLKLSSICNGWVTEIG